MCRPFGTRLINLSYPALPCRATGCFVPAGLLHCGMRLTLR
jgi:hypothetical protein